MNEDKEPTIDVARRILAELAEMTEHASLTHGLRGGERSAAQAYNRVLATFTASGNLPGGMFEPVDPDATDYGALGVQCRLLLSVVSSRRKEKERDKGGGRLGELVALAPFLDSEDLGRMVMERLGESDPLPDGLLVGLAPFLDSGIMGQIVRRGIRTPKPPQPPTAPEPPRAPAPPQTPKSVVPQETGLAPLDENVAKLRRLAEADPEHRDELLARADFDENRTDPYRRAIAGLPSAAVTEAPATLESLAAELRRPDLTMEERQRIAMRLADLSYEQSVQAAE